MDDYYIKDGAIGIAINTTFGGFDLSKEFKLALTKRGVECEYSYELERTNKILIELLDKGKINPNSRYGSDIEIYWIEKKYFQEKGFWTLEEEDGSEWVNINYRAYELWEKQQQY